MKAVTYKISESTIEKIDKVHEEFGIARSKLVEKAVKSYIENKGYLYCPSFAVTYFENTDGVLVQHISYCTDLEQAETKVKLLSDNKDLINFSIIKYETIKKY